MDPLHSTPLVVLVVDLVLILKDLVHLDKVIRVDQDHRGGRRRAVEEPALLVEHFLVLP
jgi:hypothetical protein